MDTGNERVRGAQVTWAIRDGGAVTKTGTQNRIRFGGRRYVWFKVSVVYIVGDVY